MVDKGGRRQCQQWNAFRSRWTLKITRLDLVEQVVWEQSRGGVGAE